MRPRPDRSRTLVAAVAMAVALLAALPGTLSRGTPVGGLSASPGSSAEEGSSVTVAPAFSPTPGTSDVGPAGANVSLTVDVGLASRDPSGLAAFVNATQVPGLPEYRSYLTAAEANDLYGASPAAVAAAESYFERFGLTVRAHPDGLLLAVEGSAPNVALAFATSLETYRTADGTTFVDHPTAASLPRIAPWTGVLGLSTAPAIEPEVTVAGTGAQVVPDAACAAGPGGYLSPCQLATAYDFPWTTAGGANGTGETIAVIDAYSSDEPQTRLSADFDDFSHDFDLPTGTLRFEYPVPTTANLNASGVNPTWDEEDALDIEWSHAEAPGAAIDMVFSPDASTGLYFAADAVVAAGSANVISMSWGEPEVGIFDEALAPCATGCNASTDGSFDLLDPVLELAAAVGITVVAASGDCGAADGTGTAAVNYPASDPWVLGVGATNLTLGAGNSYGSETGWGGNESGDVSGGCSNDGGSGGGFSILPRPWWQTGPGTDASRGRGVPDVAMTGGTGSEVDIVFDGFSYHVGGTSVGTPIWAAIAATADQVAGRSLGALNPSLYRILDDATEYAADFHEVTEGWNGYHAGPGWNPVTGIGTPIVGALLAELAVGPEASSSLASFVYASPRFGAAPLTVQFTTATSGGTGSYALQGVYFGDGNASALVDGGTEHTFPTAGVYEVQAYTVDSSGNISASPPVVVDVGGGIALQVGLNASATSIPAATTVTFRANASGSAGPFLYDFWFGDGSFADNLTSASVTHTYEVDGAFCAEVVARNPASPFNAGASSRIGIAVGGGTPGSCGNPTEPLTLRAATSIPERDAPADFPSPFTVTGGATAPGGLASETGLASSDPYTAACDCTILREAGSYTLQAWENDTVNGQATATANVTVAPPLDATFTASRLSGPAPLAVTFSVTATGGDDASAATTRWTFGNGAGATGASVATTYTTPGEYVAFGDLSDACDGNASEAFVLDVTGSGAVAPGITATITPAVNVSSGTTVAWNGSALGSSTALNGSILAWEFGNGGSSFGSTASETFFAPQDLPANDLLEASVALDGPGLTPLVVVSIPLPDFFAEEAGGFLPAVDALQLSVAVAPLTGTAPLSISGTGAVSGPGGAGITWAFGNGANSGGANATHIYAEAGAFVVAAEAKDGFLDTASRLFGIVVDAKSSTPRSGPPLTEELVAAVIVAAAAAVAVVLLARRRRAPAAPAGPPRPYEGPPASP